MQQRSTLTLEVFPTPKEVIDTMLDCFMDSEGFKAFHDATKVVFSSPHEVLLRALIDGMERRNEKAMLENSLCPECSGELVNVHLPATREDPEENYPECSECHDSYVKRAC